jgi:protease-4
MRFLNPPDTIAILNVQGRISDATAQAVFMALREVQWQKQGIRGLLLRICSEGGSLAAAQAIAEALETLSAEFGLVVVSVVEDVALSAAFFLMLAARHTVATPAATLGAVGAIVGCYDTQALEERLGIRYRATRSAPLKAYLSLHPPVSPAGDAALQGLVDDVHAQFADWILARRKLDALPADAADGRMFSGRQALAHGLIDATGGAVAAVTWLAEHLGMQAPRLLHIDAAPKGGGLLKTVVERLPFGGLLARLLGLGR